MPTVARTYQENPSRNVAARVFAVLALVAAGVLVVALVTGTLSGSSSSSSQTSATQAAKSPDPYFVVGPGDSLSSIAAKEGVSEARLERLNPNLDPQNLQPQNCVDIIPHGCRKLAAKSG